MMCGSLSRLTGSEDCSTQASVLTVTGSGILGFMLAVAGVCADQYLGPPAGYSHAGAIVFFAALLVLAPGLVGGVVGARWQITTRLQADTAELAVTRGQRLRGELAAERARVARKVSQAVLRGLRELRLAGEMRSVQNVMAAERIARDLLHDMRELLGQLRGPATEPRQPVHPVPELHARVTAALVAGDRAGAGEVVSVSSGAWLRLTLASPALADALLAAGALTLSVLVAVQHVADGVPWQHRVAAATAAAVIVLPFAWARRWPMQAAIACNLATIGYVLLAAKPDPLSGLPPVGQLILAPLFMGAMTSLRRSAAGLAICLACLTVAMALDNRAGLDPGSYWASVAVVVGCWAAGRVMSSSLDAVAASSQEAITARQEDREQEIAALRAQRARLARELHDAVGHAMTVIVLQGMAARRVWQTDRSLAADHLENLRRAIAQAVEELHPLLISLELDDAGAAGLSDLEALAERARSCGLRVRVEATSVSPALPADVDLTLRRIAQEALTNAARHAPNSDVLIHVDREPAGARISIVNDAPPGPALKLNGSGVGIRGMAERVMALGGTFAANPTPDGGFTVSAYLPTTTGAAVTGIRQ